MGGDRLSDAWTLWPLAALAAGSLVAFLAARLVGPRAGDAVAALASLVALVGFALAADDAPVDARLAGEVLLRVDAVAALLGVLAAATALAVSAHHALAAGEAPRERSALVLVAALGVAGVGHATDLFNLYVFFEMLALASFALVATARGPAAARESFRYFVVNAAGSLLALVGIGLAYLESGSLALGGAAAGPFSPVAAALLVVGFGTKAALAPMQAWLPGTYATAPPGVSALLGGAVTVSGAFALAKAMQAFGADVARVAGLALVALALATMTLGNLAAIRERAPRRILAFSSLAHGGYVLLALGVGVAYGSTLALFAACFHALSHGLLKGGAFLAVGDAEDVDALRAAGSLRRIALIVLLLGLAGAPPTLGFFGKLLLAQGVASGAGAAAWLVAGAFLANAVLSLAYYVPLATALLRPLDAPRAAPSAGLAAAALALVVLAAGLAPWFLVELASRAGEALAGGLP